MSQAGRTSGNGGSSSVVIIDTSPSKTISDFDDLINESPGKFDWNIVGFIADSFPGTSTNPGLVRLISSTGGSFSLGSHSFPFALGGGTFSMNFVFNMSGLSDAINNYTIFIGLLPGSTNNLSTITDGCYFKYTNSVNGGNWQVVTTNASVSTIVNTTTPAATGFHNYGIEVNAAGTSVAFFIDGVQVSGSPLTTNIPTTGLSPFIGAISTGSPPPFYVDLFYYTQTLTVSRGPSNNVSILNSFSNINTQTFIANGTYTPTTGMKYCIVEVVGGGGGGGGAVVKAGVANNSGGGGGGGGYARKVISSSTIGVSQTVTIGAGGIAGTNTGGTGGTGGTTSLGSLISASGGIGGLGGNSTAKGNFSIGGNGGIGSNGDFNATGGVGGYGEGFVVPGVFAAGASGQGGNSIFGGGGLSYTQDAAAIGSNGKIGYAFGGGGGGAMSFQDASYIGGVGAAGIVIITEYIG